VVTEHLGDLPPDPSLSVALELERRGRAEGPLQVRSPPEPFLWGNVEVASPLSTENPRASILGASTVRRCAFYFILPLRP
jgi:hypothetical protein